MLIQKEKIGNRNYIFTYQTPFDWNLNIHLILGKKQHFLIDTGLGPGSLKEALALIREKAPEQPMTVINTHAHWDHVFGNGAADLRHCPIIAHDLCRENMDKSWNHMAAKNMAHALGVVEKQLPTITFSKELSFPEENIYLFHTPGHSRDSISILDTLDKVLNAGDNIGDAPDALLPVLDCTGETYIRTLRQYEALDFQHLLSGHNKILPKETIHKILSEMT